MPKLSGKMNERERQICARLREFRERAGQSRLLFASILRLSHDKLASIEYGRTPLRAETAIQIAKLTGCNLNWLAEGTGPVFGTFPHPDLIAIIPLRWTFSRTWDLYFKRALKPGAKQFSDFSDATEAISGADASAYCKEEIEGLLKFLPPAMHLNFYCHISKACRDFVAMKQAKITELSAAKSGASQQSSKNKLTNLATFGEMHGVKPLWPVIKRQVQETTAAPGAKSRLAAFLRVDLTRVSRWLADSRTAPEPGAEIALKMEYWVNHPEVRQPK